MIHVSVNNHFSVYDESARIEQATFLQKLYGTGHLLDCRSLFSPKSILGK
jgi:hypothetical protein